MDRRVELWNGPADGREVAAPDGAFALFVRCGDGSGRYALYRQREAKGRPIRRPGVDGAYLFDFVGYRDEADPGAVTE
jgi:hypothetical protein